MTFEQFAGGITTLFFVVLFFYIKYHFSKAVTEACAKEAQKIFKIYTPLFLKQVSEGVADGLEHLRDEKILTQQQIQAVDLILNQCIQRSSSQTLIVNRKQKQKYKGPKAA